MRVNYAAEVTAKCGSGPRQRSGVRALVSKLGDQHMYIGRHVITGNTSVNYDTTCKSHRSI